MADDPPPQNEVEMDFTDVKATSSTIKKIRLKSSEPIESLIEKAHKALEKA